MTVIDEAEIDEVGRDLRHALVADLKSRDALRSPRWVNAFETVPRHVFVPSFLLDRDHTGTYEPLNGADPAQRREWLEGVYADEPLATQVNGEEWVSSSSQPALMARMLEALDIAGDERVLEVGAGTGYNAALLCEGLGDERVVSVDIDPIVVADARGRLNGCGYQPLLAATDGAAGYPEAAPYDRVIATCSMVRVPSAWISQTTAGGLILVNLYRDLGGGALALLHVTDGQASGPFLPFPGGFMPNRTHPTVHGVDLLEAHNASDVATRPTRIDAGVLRDDAFGMFAALRIAAQRLVLLPDNEPEQHWLLARDGSWAYQTSHNGNLVANQGGPIQLWDALENAHAEWVALGRPSRESFGLTVSGSGEHLIWHGSPDGSQWTLSG